MTFKELIIYIISIILMGILFFVVREDLAGKLTAFLVCLILIIYFAAFINGDYFESSEWHGKYTEYINEHDIESKNEEEMEK